MTTMVQGVMVRILENGQVNALINDWSIAVYNLITGTSRNDVRNRHTPRLWMLFTQRVESPTKTHYVVINHHKPYLDHFHCDARLQYVCQRPAAALGASEASGISCPFMS